MKKIYILIVFSLFFVLNFFAEELPYLKGVTVHTRVMLNQNSGIFFYMYTISNSNSSSGDIFMFDIDISRNPSSVAYDTIGLRFKRPWMENSFRREFEYLKNNIIPVGFPDVPKYWGGMIGNNYVASFDSDGRNKLMPGMTMDGFVLMSKGLPGIRTFIAHPYYDPNDYYPSIDDVSEEEAEQIINQVEKDYVQISFRGITIGPVAPPAIFNAVSYLDTLLSYTRQSKDLGWITNQIIADKYEGYFTMAQNMLQQNRITETRAKLQEVLRDVEADSGAFLTSEAYALLRYNTEYLLSQISESEVTLNDLIAYIRKAQEEGKISPEGIANSLISKLEEAKRELEKGKSKQAVNALNAFLNELSGQHQKHISDEVYGYLKEKVERLISRIDSSG